MLNSNGLYLDVNAKGKSGKTVLQAILCNDKIQYYTPILTLFQYGYELTKEDFDYLKAFPAKTDKSHNWNSISRQGINKRCSSVCKDNFYN